MDKEIICLDTSIFIDYFRKQRKERTPFIKLSEQYDFAISIITKFEISVGIAKGQEEFWNEVFDKLTIIPLNEVEIDKATEIFCQLRKTNKIIGLPDILIAATAIVNDLKLATLNQKDFSRITGLKIVENQ
jgi:predicted nucleic acid-binding protein